MSGAAFTLVLALCGVPSPAAECPVAERSEFVIRDLASLDECEQVARKVAATAMLRSWECRPQQAAP